MTIDCTTYFSNFYNILLEILSFTEEDFIPALEESKKTNKSIEEINIYLCYVYVLRDWLYTLKRCTFITDYQTIIACQRKIFDILICFTVLYHDNKNYNYKIISDWHFSGMYKETEDILSHKDIVEKEYGSAFIKTVKEYKNTHYKEIEIIRKRNGWKKHPPSWINKGGTHKNITHADKVAGTNYLAFYYTKYRRISSFVHGDNISTIPFGNDEESSYIINSADSLYYITYFSSFILLYIICLAKLYKIFEKFNILNKQWNEQWKINKLQK